MKKYLLFFIFSWLAVHGFAQERLFTEKEHGGAENGIFGKTNDEINVSPTGQLSYEIPIPALPGTGGMKPSLSIAYNSSTKNGLAGYGFDLTGLSIINRVPSDRFHDMVSTAIDFTSSDHFALDGQRLINYDYASDTEAEYRTENNTFAKIIAKGKSTNPTSFKVYTKSGLIYDYVSVAKALGKAESDSTLFWLVSKISDTKGNYMTVTYGGDDSTNDFYPTRVDYTGNESMGLTPYASIRFIYQDNYYTPTTYVNGARVKRSKIIFSISLYMGNQSVRNFQFSYQDVNRKYQLSKIIENTSDGEHKNPTRLAWSNLTDFNVKNYNYTQTQLIHKATLTVGDFNGDGMADFIATPENDKAGWKGWKLFISHGTYFEQVASGTWNWNDDNLEQVVCGDFNGDGKSDFVCTSDWNKSNWDGYQLYLMPSDKNSLLTEITDGLGNQTKIDYKYLSDNTVFTRGKTHSYPLVSIGSSWPVVSSVSTPDGVGGTNVVSYKYENALFHNNGRGLLGFEKCHIKDEATNTLNTTEYSVNTDKFVIAPVHSQTTINGVKVEECDYTYTLKTGYAPSSYNTSIYNYVPTWTRQRNYEFNTGITVKDVTTSNDYDLFGNTIEIVVNDGNVETTTTKTNNLCGQLARSIDNGGTSVTYKYNADGKCIELVGPRTKIHMEYDLAGNRIFLDDPDLGQSSDTYNAYGELVQHEDGHGTTTYEYDKGGRIIQENRPDMTILSQYDKKWKGALDHTSVARYQGASKDYEYDQYGRIIKETVVIERLGYMTYFSYDAEGHISTIIYPSGQEIKNSYDSSGTLVAVSDVPTGKEYWRLLDLDARGQVEREQYGNGLLTNITHDAKMGTISSISTPGVQNWAYSYDAVGNLTTRKDNGRNLTESFSYDGLNRLLEVRKNGNVILSMGYDTAGNIIEKSDVGTYSYEEGSNRLTSITDCVRTPLHWDEIKYNSLDKVTYAASGGKSLSIDYGPDKERVKLSIAGVRKYYPNSYFEESIEARYVQNTSYVFALGKVVAIITDSPRESASVMYVHHDQLGSIQAYSDENGKLYQELSYDAWGARRNPDNWESYTSPTEANAWKERGFGGHEHIDLLDMINMDGRMYDPVVGRFISADPFVQSPDFTQSLNRYAYCINNPLSLIDPSGYSWFSKNWKSLVASVVGVAVSVVTAGSGSGIGVAIIAGAAGGAAGALTGALLNGANIGQIAKATFTGAFWGGLAGAANNLTGDINDFWLRIGAHTLSEGTMEGLQGGNMLHGFMMGATSSLGGSFIDNNLESLGKVGEVAANSILSGTVDEIGGGKFANGAITGAFTILFNDMMHKFKETEGMRVSRIDKPLEPVYPEFALISGAKVMYNLSKKVIVEGFESFAAFKKANGKAGEGYNWHHIVEQTPANIKRFGAKRIHNANNLIKIPGGKGSIHAKISGYYSSKQPFTYGKTVRQWLSTKSYTEQYNFGLKLLRNFGYK